MEIENFIGVDIDEQCPECGKNLIMDRTGCKWCNCGWSTDESLLRFIKSLNK